MEREVKRTAPKRKVRKSFIFVMLLFIVSILVILSTTVLFPINNINVEYSGKKYTQKEILSAANVSIGENMLMLSESEVQKRVSTKLTYIGQVELQKKFPDTVVLKPIETTASICLKSGKQYLLLDSNYKLLEIIKKPNKKLTAINGLELEKIELGKTVKVKSQEEYQYVKIIQEKLKKTNLKINYIDVKNSSDVTVYLDKRFKIQLGTFVDLEEKLNFSVDMLEGINKKNKKSEGTLNLTYFSNRKEGIFAREPIKIEYFK